MQHWFSHDIVDGGRLPLLLFFIGFIVGFAGTRLSVRLIRADVRWWFGNVSAGQTHIHHMVFGVVLSLVSGVAIIAVSMTGSQTAISILACAFGVGAALILDEFALIFYLRDVYWAEEGRASVDAVWAAVGATGMVLLGFRPLELFQLSGLTLQDGWVELLVSIALAAVSLALAAMVLAKGKIWTGLLGIFVWPLLVFGAIRLARPGSPWARWRYTTRPRRMERSLRRERRLRRPVIRGKIFLQDLVAGRPDVPHAISAAEDILDDVVQPAAPPADLQAAISAVGGGSGTLVGLPVEARSHGPHTSARTRRTHMAAPTGEPRDTSTGSAPPSGSPEDAVSPENDGRAHSSAPA